jgi:Zn-dependent peptidase ImmA (M78 family)
MTQAGVNPSMLVWARNRAGLSHADLKPGKSRAWITNLPDWEKGIGGPTFEQARALAKIFRVPFGYLFLLAPPVEDVSLPDLRTVGDKPGRLSVDLRDVVLDALRKQDWLHQYRREHRLDPVTLVGSSKLTDAPAKVAEQLRTALGLNVAGPPLPTDPEEYRRHLVERAEAAGVVVLQSGMVGGNTKRLLDVDDFRGFALADDLAPLVFINTQDIPHARSFTLIHELAHIALSISGVSNAPVASEEAPPLRAEELFCNKVAAEFLVPSDAFLRAWDERQSLDANAARLSNLFRVSHLVIARRAFDASLVKAAEYWRLVKIIKANARADKLELAESEGGPGFLLMAKVRNGKTLISTVVHAAIAGEVLYRDAASLLGVKPAHIEKLAEGRRGAVR